MLRNKRAKLSLFSFQDIITTVTGVMILVTLLTALQLVRPAGQAAPAKGEAPGDLRQRLARLQAVNDDLAEQLEMLRARARRAAAASPETVGQLEQQRDRLLAQAQTLRQWHAQQAPRVQQAIAQSKAEQTRREQELAALEVELAKVQRDLRRAASGQHRLYRFRPSGARTWWIADVGPRSWRLWELDRQGRPTGRGQEFAQPRAAARLGAFQTWLGDRSRQQEAIFLLVRPSAVEDFERLGDMLRERGFALGFDLLDERQSFDLFAP